MPLILMLFSCENKVTDAVDDSSNVFVFETVLYDLVWEGKKTCSAKITFTFSEEDKCVYYIFSYTWHNENAQKLYHRNLYHLTVALKDKIGNHLHVIRSVRKNGTIPIGDLSYSKLKRTKEIELKFVESS